MFLHQPKREKAEQSEHNPKELEQIEDKLQNNMKETGFLMIGDNLLVRQIIPFNKQVFHYPYQLQTS